MPQYGIQLADRLRLKVIGKEGHDLKIACVSCDSTDAGRIHQDTGVFFCYSCRKALNAFDLCKIVLHDHETAKKMMVDVGLFQDRPSPNGDGQPRPAADAGSVAWLTSPSERVGPKDHTLSTDAVLDKVAAAKGLTAAALLAYGVEVADDTVYFPMYGPDGEVCSGFSLTADGGKGQYAPGKPVGLFLPSSRRPQPGETWCIVEGCKDAAALFQLGYPTAGLPGSCLSPKFAPMFRDCIVVCVPDADRPGTEGAQKTADVLHGTAKSVYVAQLPVAVKNSGGEDVRDVLRDHGADAIHKVIAEAEPAKEPERPAFVKMLSGSDLMALDLKPRFLIRGVMVEGQPMVVGGRSKTLKTNVGGVALAVALGSGTPFLGKFESQQVAVGFWSGESGAATIRETAIRIAETSGVIVSNCAVRWCFALPKLSQSEHLDHLRRTIEAHELKVVILDPLYQSLLTADNAGQAGNLFAMGAILQPVTEWATAAGITLVVLHHFRKTGQVDDDNPCGLEELSQSGAAEWARQWLLLQRRVPYQGDGRHLLWMRCGGSAGHSSLWGLTIDEGQLDPDTFSGRTWEVTVAPHGEAREEARHEKEARKAAEQEKREADYRDRLLDVLRKASDGDTARALRVAARINADAFDRAISALEQEGRAVACEVTKTGRKYDGFKPTGK